MSKKKVNKLPKHTENEVNLQFKLLSAIGIIIIVAGHCYKGGFSLGYDWFPNYSYNIALLVFISGYFFKDKYEDAPLKYIWKRTKRLLIPAYLWNIVYGLFILLMTNFGYTIAADKVNPFNLFVSPFIDGEAFLYNLGSWFVYPLFAVSVVNVLIRKLLGMIKLKNEYLIFVVYLAVGIVGVNLAMSGKNQDVMKLVTRSMFFLPCFQLGKLYKAKLEAKDNLPSVAYFAILFALQLVLLTFCNDLEYTPSSMTKFLNGPVIPFVTAITGIAFWLRISKLVTPAIKHWKPITLVADNTYSIMIHQMLGYMSVKWLFALISVITPLFSDFSFMLLKTNIWYYYLPKGTAQTPLTQYAIIYLAGGIFLPIGIKKLCDLVANPIKKAIKKKP